MDQTFTNRIGAFLQKEQPTDQEIKEAATLLLQCNPSRERAIYNSAMVRPRATLPWVVSDLKKYYAIRQHGHTLSDVPRFNEQTVRQVRQTLAVKPEGVEDISPVQVPITGLRGKRPDHDRLPEAIQQLWERNSELWKKEREAHNRLLVMVSKPDYQACDGNELCHALLETDNQIRKNYEAYDSYVIKDAGDSVDNFTDDLKTIQNARTTITRGLQRKTQDEASRQKIQDAVNTLKALQQVMKPATIEKLKAIGIDA